MMGRVVRRDAEFGRRLRLAMNETGILAKDLAVAAGVKPGTIVRWRKGECPDELRYQRIARALGVREEWLKTGEPPQYALGEPGRPQESRSPVEPITPAEIRQRQVALLEMFAKFRADLALYRSAGVVPDGPKILKWIEDMERVAALPPPIPPDQGSAPGASPTGPTDDPARR